MTIYDNNGFTAGTVREQSWLLSYSLLHMLSTIDLKENDNQVQLL